MVPGVLFCVLGWGALVSRRHVPSFEFKEESHGFFILLLTDPHSLWPDLLGLSRIRLRRRWNIVHSPCQRCRAPPHQRPAELQASQRHLYACIHNGSLGSGTYRSECFRQQLWVAGTRSSTELSPDANRPLLDRANQLCSRPTRLCQPSGRGLPADSPVARLK